MSSAEHGQTAGQPQERPEEPAADRADGAGRLLASRYRVVDRLGRGGMGIVWRAVDEVLGREVAVKELRTFTDAAAPELAALRLRMQREARAAARIRHPGVVAVHDVTEVDGRPLIVMELVDGPSLDDVLSERGTLDPREAAGIGAQVMDALAAAHRVGVLHRDVKPGNILLDASGRVVLTDFGIATMEDPGDGSTTNLTRSGELVGSLDYLAPERAQGSDPAPPPTSGPWAPRCTRPSKAPRPSAVRRPGRRSPRSSPNLSRSPARPAPGPRPAATDGQATGGTPGRGDRAGPAGGGGVTPEPCDRHAHDGPATVRGARDRIVRGSRGARGGSGRAECPGAAAGVRARRAGAARPRPAGAARLRPARARGLRNARFRPRRAHVRPWHAGPRPPRGPDHVLHAGARLRPTPPQGTRVARRSGRHRRPRRGRNRRRPDQQRGRQRGERPARGDAGRRCRHALRRDHRPGRPGPSRQPHTHRQGRRQVPDPADGTRRKGRHRGRGHRPLGPVADLRKRHDSRRHLGRHLR